MNHAARSLRRPALGGVGLTAFTVLALATGSGLATATTTAQTPAGLNECVATTSGGCGGAVTGGSELPGWPVTRDKYGMP